MSRSRIRSSSSIYLRVSSSDEEHQRKRQVDRKTLLLHTRFILHPALCHNDQVVQVNPADILMFYIVSGLLFGHNPPDSNTSLVKTSRHNADNFLKINPVTTNCFSIVDGIVRNICRSPRPQSPDIFLVH